ncbi:MAG: hypothetical protein EAX96_16010 [Candidatus Lokiarchaeota archaeon]|nr:hypothetical protein [Candidatus Lokiarchaeota archaeon]
MSFLDKLKNKLGLGDFAAITKLKNEEADVYKAKERVVKEEIEKNEALSNWSKNIEDEDLRKAVLKYYLKKKEIIESFSIMITNIREDYLTPLERISQKTEILNNAIDEQEKIETRIEKAERDLEKKKYELEKEESKVDRNVEKIRKKEADVKKAQTNFDKIQGELRNMNNRVEDMKNQMEAFKYSTLKAALMKLTEHEKTYLIKANEVFEIRDHVIDNIPGEPAELDSKPPAEEKKDEE